LVDLVVSCFSNWSISNFKDAYEKFTQRIQNEFKLRVVEAAGNMPRMDSLASMRDDVSRIYLFSNTLFSCLI
jgi:hypothetical protein